MPKIMNERNIYKSIGKRIKNKRIKNKFSVCEFAEILKISTDEVKNIENENIKKLSQTVWNQIIDSLNTNKVYLITGIDNQFIRGKITNTDKEIEQLALLSSLSEKQKIALLNLLKTQKKDMNTDWFCHIIKYLPLTIYKNKCRIRTERKQKSEGKNAYKTTTKTIYDNR